MRVVGSYDRNEAYKITLHDLMSTDAMPVSREIPPVYLPKTTFLVACWVDQISSLKEI